MHAARVTRQFLRITPFMPKKDKKSRKEGIFALLCDCGYYSTVFLICKQEIFIELSDYLKIILYLYYYLTFILYISLFSVILFPFSYMPDNSSHMRKHFFLSRQVVFSGSYAVQELLNIFQIPAKKKAIPQSGHGHRKGRFLSAILSYAGIFFEKIFLKNSSKTSHPLTDSFTSLIITKDNYL